jgi:predicted RNA methylase
MIKMLNMIENIWNDSYEKDIVWYANEVAPFFDSNITEYYKNNPYGKKTRWDFWQEVINCLKELNIKEVLDIGAANGHFVYLCLCNGIDAYGIEPRTECINSSKNIFINSFKEKKIYQGSLQTFIQPIFDKLTKVSCVTVLNFLHGKGHTKDVLIKFLDNVALIADWLICSRPIDFPEFDRYPFEMIRSGLGPEKIHNVYKIKHIKSIDEKELLSCNLENISDFPENVVEEEKNIYFNSVKSWNQYECVSSLEGWKDKKYGYSYPNIHLHHRKIVDTIKNLKNIKSVCEIGAGAGVVSKYVYVTCPEIDLTCVEGADEHIVQMKENFKKESKIIEPFIDVDAKIIKSIAQEISLESESFDIVFTCTMMMHIPFILVPKAIMEINRISKRYILHVENQNNEINAVCAGFGKSQLNRLCIDYEKMYALLGVKTLIKEIYKDPHANCDCICFLGEKIN